MIEDLLAPYLEFLGIGLIPLLVLVLIIIALVKQ